MQILYKYFFFHFVGFCRNVICKLMAYFSAIGICIYGVNDPLKLKHVQKICLQMG